MLSCSQRDILQTYFQKVSPTYQMKAKIFPLEKSWIKSLQTYLFLTNSHLLLFLFSLCRGTNSEDTPHQCWYDLWLPLIHLLYRVSRLSKFKINFKFSDQHLLPKTLFHHLAGHKLHWKKLKLIIFDVITFVPFSQHPVSEHYEALIRFYLKYKDRRLFLSKEKGKTAPRAS